MTDNIVPIPLYAICNWISKRYGLKEVVLLARREDDSVSMYANDVNIDIVERILCAAIYLNIQADIEIKDQEGFQDE